MSSDPTGPTCHDDGDAIRLRCERCRGSTQVVMPNPPRSRVFECEHCEASLYWHHCPTCGLGYVGEAQAHCAVCDADDEEISFS